jgi:predicted  nucleic acid-binding Zn-ribbon protein
MGVEFKIPQDTPRHGSGFTKAEETLKHARKELAQLETLEANIDSALSRASSRITEALSQRQTLLQGVRDASALDETLGKAAQLSSTVSALEREIMDLHTIRLAVRREKSRTQAAVGALELAHKDWRDRMEGNPRW